MPPSSGLKNKLTVSCFFGFLMDTADGNNPVLLNVGELLPECKAFVLSQLL
jgi:hypothetical protein